MCFDQHFLCTVVIKPISSVAHLKLNMKPELNNFTLPKAFLTVVFDEIGIGLSKLQVKNIQKSVISFKRVNCSFSTNIQICLGKKVC